MKRYLLFDSGCCQCSKIAKAIEQEAGGKLTIRSLRDPAVKELLDRERPGWKWEPMLVEEKDDKVRIYAGTSMFLHMLVALGPIRAWKTTKLVLTPFYNLKTLENTQVAVHSGRRDFLKRSGALLAGIALFGLKPIESFADSPGFNSSEVLPEDRRKILELVKASVEYASLKDRLVSLDPSSVWQENGHFFITYDFRFTHQMIEPEGDVEFYNVAIFVISEENVVSVVTLSPDVKNMRVQIADLRRPEQPLRYKPLSKEAITRVASVQDASSRTKSRLHDVSIGALDDLECHMVCVEPIYVPGHMDWQCFSGCSVLCGGLSGGEYYACAAGCTALCWVPGYQWCNKWEKRCGTW